MYTTKKKRSGQRGKKYSFLAQADGLTQIILAGTFIRSIESPHDVGVKKQPKPQRGRRILCLVFYS